MYVLYIGFVAGSCWREVTAIRHINQTKTLQQRSQCSNYGTEQPRYVHMWKRRCNESTG